MSVHINRLRLGHAKTPEYMHRVGLRDHPFCRCESGARGDINHALLGCGLSRRKIDRFYDEVRGKIEFPTNATILLSCLSEAGKLGKMVLQFIISLGCDIFRRNIDVIEEDLIFWVFSLLYTFFLFIFFFYYR